MSVYSTSNISDALDRFRIVGGLKDIHPVIEGLRMCGRAFTVRYIPINQVTGGHVTTYIDDVRPGDVVVIDNGGRTDCTCWGDLLTRKAVKVGAAGTVVYGACRDIDSIRESGYPVFSKGKFMMTGKDRVEVESVNKPVTIAGVRVSPGDLILGDSSGVVCIPLAEAAKILEAVVEIAEKEERIATAIDKGVSLTRARKDQGYEKLQRPK